MNTSLLNQLLSPIASAHAYHQRCNKATSNHVGDDNGSSSHFQKTVCLYDWWLIKANKDFEGKRLAVAGFTSRELQAMRVFTPTTNRLEAMRLFISAPIVKRYDVFTLETADGICIALKGFINESQTIENGFSAEVFSNFRFGFPTCWEAYNKMCLEEEFTTGAGLAKNTSSLATENQCMRNSNSNPNTAPINYEVNGKNKQIVEDMTDCSENVSEKVTTYASKESDWQKHSAEDDNTQKAKDHHASEHSLSSLSRDINAICLQEDNLSLPGEPSSDNVTPERMDNLKSCSEGSKGTVQKSKTQEPGSLENLTISNAESEECPIPRASDVEILNSSDLGPAVPMVDSRLDLRKSSMKSKTQEPACVESIIIRNAASGECSIPEVSNIENLNSFNLDPAVGNPGVDLRITPSRPKNSEEQKENNGVTCGNKDCSALSLPHEPVASGLEGSNLSTFGLRVTHSEYLSTSINEDPNYQKLRGNCVDDTIPAVESVINVNAITPPKVHTSAIDVIPSNSGSRKTQKYDKHSRFTGSVKCKRKELMSETYMHMDGEKLKRCSLGTTILSGKKMNSSEAARKQSINRMFRNMIGNSRGKEQEHTTKDFGLHALNSNRNRMGSATLASDQTSNLQGMNIFEFGNDAIQEPIHDTVVKNNSKQGKDHRKEPQAGTPRQKPNSSAGSHNEFVSSNHQCESETAVGEREATCKGCSSKKRARRKIYFDTQASPLTRGRSKNIVSPESLSLKRSRSGRLLLPSLDFWRNQIPVYDADRRITGIQVETPSKGGKSEPLKQQRR